MECHGTFSDFFCHPSNFQCQYSSLTRVRTFELLPIKSVNCGFFVHGIWILTMELIKRITSQFPSGVLYQLLISRPFFLYYMKYLNVRFIFTFVFVYNYKPYFLLFSCTTLIWFLVNRILININDVIKYNYDTTILLY